MKKQLCRTRPSTPWADSQTESLKASIKAVLVLADGTVFCGQGAGATGKAIGEVCFSTAMTGYQEVLTDPTHAGKLVIFTFPHIGNVGTNDEDGEAKAPTVRGIILRAAITQPSSWRAQKDFQTWLEEHKIIGISDIDTRALTAHIRDGGAIKGVICHAPDGNFDLEALRKEAAHA